MGLGAACAPGSVERLESDCLHRDRASAQPRLGLLDPTVRIRPSNLHDTTNTIYAALFEREQLRGPESRRGRYTIIGTKLGLSRAATDRICAPGRRQTQCWAVFLAGRLGLSLFASKHGA